MSKAAGMLLILGGILLLKPGRVGIAYPVFQIHMGDCAYVEWMKWLGRILTLERLFAW